MNPGDKVRLSVFLAAVAVVYIAAAIIVLSAIRRKIRREKPVRRRRSVKWARRCVLALAALGIACLAWGYFVEPYRLEVTHVRIEAAGLAGATRPIRLVHISDLHCDEKVRNEEELPRVIADCQPDLIVFTGDAANSSGALANFRRCMTRIARIAPTFACLGNWDRSSAAATYFDKTGVVELDGARRRLEIAGTHLWVAGAAAGRLENADRALDGIPSEDFTLFLYHFPSLIEHLASRGVDLHCAGHIHGGQVALPFYGALITLSRDGKRFESGLYRVGAAWLYVNRGIGMEGGTAPRVRFCSRPEVTLIEIAPKRSRQAPTGDAVERVEGKLSVQGAKVLGVANGAILPRAGQGG